MTVSIARLTTYMYHNSHWFTDKEAWALFRLFAILETVGWTMLIAAIIYRKFDLPLDDTFVSIAGRLHGVFFVLYFVIVFVVARSMMWGVWRVALALVAGMPPYTALLFEQAMAYHRKKYPKTVEPPVGFDT